MRWSRRPTRPPRWRRCALPWAARPCSLRGCATSARRRWPRPLTLTLTTIRLSLSLSLAPTSTPIPNPNPNPNPSARQVAAASLAEVYRANLPDGTPVAVKVQRPGLERKVALDFYVMRRILALVQARFELGPGLGLAELFG